MKKTFLFLAVALLFFSCGKEEPFTETCISSCSSSVPGKINIAIEDHTGLTISNLVIEINGVMTTFPLFPKPGTGSYSCWQSFDQVDLISAIQFNIGDNATHQEDVDYKNLANQREYSIDIRSDPNTGIRVQLVSDPDCVSSAN